MCLMQSHTLCSVPVTSDMWVFFGQMMDLFNSRGMIQPACPFQFACTIWGQLVVCVCLALFGGTYRGFLLGFLLICLNSYGRNDPPINFYDIQCNPYS